MSSKRTKARRLEHDPDFGLRRLRKWLWLRKTPAARRSPKARGVLQHMKRQAGL